MLDMSLLVTDQIDVITSCDINNYFCFGKKKCDRNFKHRYSQGLFLGFHRLTRDL